MPFSMDDFKAVCHTRAMTAAILAMDVNPLAATLITEHSASFPKVDDNECYITVVIGANGRTFESVKYARSFSLNLLNENQVDIAHNIYSGNIASLEWKKMHNVPYLVGTNTIICSVHNSYELGPNRLVVGHVMRVIKPTVSHPPLINYSKTYCKVDGTRIPVHNPAISNQRLT